MKPIRLVPILKRVGWAYEADHSELAPGLLERLSGKLAQSFGVPCDVDRECLDAAFALDDIRDQYYSTAILRDLQKRAAGRNVRTLGVTALDLFVPIFTFVFGEAQLDGDCALVSLHRLHEEFYGLPAREDLLFERLAKEAIHELGHTFGLRHCLDWNCVMASSYGVERIDVKSDEFCARCRAVVAGCRTRATVF